VNPQAGRRPHGGALALQGALAALLPALAALLLLGMLGAQLALDAVPLRAGSAAWLLAWPVCTLGLAWGGWSVWRAAQADARRGGAPAWRWGALAMVAATALLWLAVLAADVVPQMGERLQWALGRDPEGQLQLQPAPDGRRLRLQGSIGLGDGERALAQLSSMPQLQLLELQGGGTRLGEARRIADAVRARGLQTRMVGACDNDCVLVFLAGTGRQMMPGAQLGLNRPQTPRLDPLGDSLVRRGWAKAWQQAGLPADFIQRGLRSPPGSPWSPDAAHLQASTLLGPADWPLDVAALPHGQGLLAADFAQALQSHWLWRAMDSRFPGALDLAAGHMATRHAAGADAQTLQLAAQDVLQATLPALLAESDSLLHEQFTALLADQLRAAQAAGDAACSGVLQANPAARRALPAALRVREAAWLKDALASLPPERLKRRRGDLEREVMRRTLGERAPAQLASLWGPQRSWGADPGCQRAAQLLATANALPPSERRLAARMMFLPS
jgi:hypothetical protein